jgi:hypothetical protein
MGGVAAVLREGRKGGKGRKRKGRKIALLRYDRARGNRVGPMASARQARR